MNDRPADPRLDLLLYAAWLVSLVATVGSLYFSEVRHFVPCTLCWYQRILMYPQVVLLGVAAWSRDVGVVRYALPLTALGAVTASYHVLDQKVPGFGFAGVCASGVPCNVSYVNYFGFVTIPVMSLTAFLMISTLLVLVARTRR